MEFRLRGKEPVIGTYRRGMGPLVDMESAATSEIHQKGKLFTWKNVKVIEIMEKLSNDGGDACINPHAVRRTPRVLVLHSYSRDDIEMTVKGALQRGSSHSFLKNLIIKLNAENPQLFRAMILCDMLEGMEPVIGTYRRSTCPLVDMESAAIGEIHQREKNYQKKVKVDEIMNNLPNDGGEACRGTKEGITDTVQGKVDMEISSANINFHHGVRGRKARRLSQEVDASCNILNSKTAVPNVDIVHIQHPMINPLPMVHIHGREVDIRAMSELNRALDKKEAILTELRNTNDNKLENRNGGGCLKGSKPFKKLTAMVSSALHKSSKPNITAAETPN
ncbi:hypothetical protein V6N13_012463 [Hibiscus sabdariffa]|uniref:Uncharacterized protein n=1 Tax=Hibiscus sabdariffa TaxID=183260 RepID=A0ABR2SFY4_9ROSI